MYIVKLLGNRKLTIFLLFIFFSCEDEQIYINTICKKNILVADSIKDATDFEVYCKVPLDGKYWQGVTTDGVYIYVSHQGSGNYPNLVISKYEFNGTSKRKRKFHGSKLFDNLNDWNASDWCYSKNDNKIFAVFGRTKQPRATKIVKIDPFSLDLEEVVYQSNEQDNNSTFYGEGIDYYDDHWWISYEGYSTDNIDIIDKFDSDWNFEKRYKVVNLNFFIDEIGYNRIQGITFRNGYLWFTIHPQKPGWTYRGSLVKAEIRDEEIHVLNAIDLSDNYGNSIGEGIQWFNQFLLLNGFYNQVIILNPKSIDNE